MSVTVTGRGTASAAPDLARVDLSVAVRGALRAMAVHDLGPVRRAARDAAWADARSAAEQLAALAGRRLGPVTEVVDGEPRPGPEPRRYATSAGGGPDVDPGRLEVAHNVTVTGDLA